MLFSLLPLYEVLARIGRRAGIADFIVVPPSSTRACRPSLMLSCHEHERDGVSRAEEYVRKVFLLRSEDAYVHEYDLTASGINTGKDIIGRPARCIHPGTGSKPKDVHSAEPKHYFPSVPLEAKSSLAPTTSSLPPGLLIPASHHHTLLQLLFGPNYRQFSSFAQLVSPNGPISSANCKNSFCLSLLANHVQFQDTNRPALLQTSSATAHHIATPGQAELNIQYLPIRRYEVPCSRRLGMHPATRHSESHPANRCNALSLAVGQPSSKRAPFYMQVTALPSLPRRLCTPEHAYMKPAEGL
ncbi:uncharacterized protein CLUP02_12288 [Colletotrichum lupini]|uniref:Uncharacterized protein n=1 Tax=Colletotrichum lupini TaxID=145971 RepID=A0A9Q8T218_9PEZI|nr:uncharacterized protein CLUP02_12288 [Colletotrichum lupini]UQC86786.1 hypothetical protein CLUP02_12288 [Colletotrichum lupini]